MVDDSKINPVDAASWPRELLRARAAKFAALGQLFQLDVSKHSSAVQILLDPCPGIEECPVRGLAVAEAGRDAMEWARNVADSLELKNEHTRLFGSDDLVTQMPIVAPCASMYLGSSADAVAEEVSQIYLSSGFCEEDSDPSCTHASVELRFMAHLLDRAADGDRRALVTAHDFIVDHLFTWGVVFSAATFARSEHAVTRFAGLMLEHLLFCEVEHARELARAYGALKEPTSPVTA